MAGFRRGTSNDSWSDDDDDGHSSRNNSQPVVVPHAELVVPDAAVASAHPNRQLLVTALQVVAEKDTTAADDNKEETNRASRLFKSVRQKCKSWSFLLFMVITAVLVAAMVSAVTIVTRNNNGNGNNTAVTTASPETLDRTTNEPTIAVVPTLAPTIPPSAVKTMIQSWIPRGSDIRGDAEGDGFGEPMALSMDGSIVAIGAPFAGNYSGQVQVLQWQNDAINMTTNSTTDGHWEALGPTLLPPGPLGSNDEDRFGSSVALSADGKTLAVGATRYDTTEGFAGGYVKVFAHNEDTNQWNPLGATITGGGGNDLFGDAVVLSADGTTLAVSAVANDDNGVFAGQVRVFKYSSTENEWIQQGSSLIGKGARDYFGTSIDVSADGTILAVGAPGGTGKEPSDEASSGQVRIFQFNAMSQEWYRFGSVVPGMYGDEKFGEAVGLSSSGLTLVVGAPLNSDNGDRSGQIRVFDYNANTGEWVQQGSALAGVAPYDEFGSSVAISADGSIVAAGSVWNEDTVVGPYLGSGHVRVFQYDGNTEEWNLVDSALTGDAALDSFGRSVALSADGRVLAVGADRFEGEGPGYVRVFDGVQ